MTDGSEKTTVDAAYRSNGALHKLEHSSLPLVETDPDDISAYFWYGSRVSDGGSGVLSGTHKSSVRSSSFVRKPTVADLRL